MSNNKKVPLLFSLEVPVHYMNRLKLLEIEFIFVTKLDKLKVRVAFVFVEDKELGSIVQTSVGITAG